jgi:hypothetical protein
MRAHHERNLWFGEPDFSYRFHRTNETDQGRLLDVMLLGRFAPMQDLLLYAKHLFVKPWFRKLLPLGSGEAETGDARGRHGGIREELARGIVLRLGGPLLGKPDIEPTSPNDRVRPEAAFGSIHRTCLSA